MKLRTRFAVVGMVLVMLGTAAGWAFVTGTASADVTSYNSPSTPTLVPLW